MNLDQEDLLDHLEKLYVKKYHIYLIESAIIQLRALLDQMELLDLVDHQEIP